MDTKPVESNVCIGDNPFFPSSALLVVVGGLNLRWKFDPSDLCVFFGFRAQPSSTRRVVPPLVEKKHAANLMCAKMTVCMQTNTSVLVSNVAPTATEHVLAEFFSFCGKIVKIAFLPDSTPTYVLRLWRSAVLEALQGLFFAHNSFFCLQ